MVLKWLERPVGMVSPHMVHKSLAILFSLALRVFNTIFKTFDWSVSTLKYHKTTKTYFYQTRETC